MPSAFYQFDLETSFRQQLRLCREDSLSELSRVADSAPRRTFIEWFCLPSGQCHSNDATTSSEAPWDSEVKEKVVPVELKDLSTLAQSRMSPDHVIIVSNDKEISREKSSAP